MRIDSLPAQTLEGANSDPYATINANEFADREKNKGA